jgi:hypothetical protein
MKTLPPLPPVVKGCGLLFLASPVLLLIVVWTVRGRRIMPKDKVRGGRPFVLRIPLADGGMEDLILARSPGDTTAVAVRESVETSAHGSSRVIAGTLLADLDAFISGWCATAPRLVPYPGEVVYELALRCPAPVVSRTNRFLIPASQLPSVLKTLIEQVPSAGL